MGFFIKIPFPFGIQFFKDVFYHAVGVVHTHLAVVLKSAFQYQFALGVFAFDAVLVASPFSAVHGVQITSRRAAPVFTRSGEQASAAYPLKMRISGSKFGYRADICFSRSQRAGRGSVLLPLWPA